AAPRLEGRVGRGSSSEVACRISLSAPTWVYRSRHGGCCGDPKSDPASGSELSPAAFSARHLSTPMDLHRRDDQALVGEDGMDHDNDDDPTIGEMRRRRALAEPCVSDELVDDEPTVLGPVSPEDDIIHRALASGKTQKE